MFRHIVLNEAILFLELNFLTANIRFVLSLVCNFTFNRLTPEQRLQIEHIYYQNNGSVRAKHSALRPIFGRHNRPAESVIPATMKSEGFAHSFLRLQGRRAS